MKYIIAGGMGKQGKAITRYLRKHSPSIQTVTIDLEGTGADFERDPCYYKNTSEDIVINCLRPKQSLQLFIQSAYVETKGFLGLGGDDKFTLNIQKKYKTAENKPQCVILDTGLAPGLVSAIAGQAARENKKDVYIMCGGLAENPRDQYVKSFNIDGLVSEYLGTAQIIRQGKVIRVPTLLKSNRLMSPTEYWLEGRHTSAGLSFTPQALEGKLRTLEYFTIRHPDYWNYLLTDILWRPDVIKVLDQCTLEVSSKHPDKVILLTCIDGSWKRYYWQYDHENNISALAQATGYTVGAVATMIADNLIPKSKGFIGMHDIDLNELIKRIRLMPNQMTETI